MTSAHEVAAEIRRRLPNVGQTKLHKLLYYCDGWHLAWTGKPLFDEAIKAYDRGPVVASVWGHEKHSGTWVNSTANQLGDRQLATIDFVIGKYGHLSGSELSELTHAEGPWSSVRGDNGNDQRPSPVIPKESLRCWFEADDEFRRLKAQTDELRRTAVDPFSRTWRSTDVDAAVLRATSGHKVQDSRPS